MKRPPVIRFLLLLICAVVIGFGLTQTVRAENVEKSSFVSPETVAVGCGAGLTAGIFASALPLIWSLPGQHSLVTVPIVTAWGLIGCGVGVVAGLSAVLSQAGLDALK